MISFKEKKTICENKGEMTPFKIKNETVYIPVNYIIEKNKTFLQDPNFKKFELAQFTIADHKLKDFALNYFDVPELELDNDFFVKSQKFVDELSIEEKIMLSGYTYQGDAFVNKYLLSLEFEDKVKEFEDFIMQYTPKSYIFPLYVQLKRNMPVISRAKNHDSLMQIYVDYLLNDVQKNQQYLRLMKKCVKEYYEDLMKIFEKAPAITKKMTVFRGTRTLYYKNKVDDIYHNNSFMSTTIDPINAIKFADAKNNCCLKKINLNEGFKAIFMEPFTQVKHEFEILIAPHNSFRILANEPDKPYNSKTIFDQTTNYKDIIDYFCDEEKTKPSFQTNYTLTEMESV